MIANFHGRRKDGVSLLDVMASLLVIGLSFAALFAANARAMGMLKSAKQAAVASKCLQQRIEQIRNYNWTQVTDADAMQDLYSVPPLPSAELPGFSEKVTASAFTPTTTSGNASAAPVAPYLQITRDSSGTVALVSDSVDLVAGPTVRIDVQISWPGPGGATRMRETSVIVANGGLGR
jgi:Tfp pilus assembly protein PilV